MKKTHLLATAALALTMIAPGAMANDSKMTQEFVKTAAVAGQFEIESSKLALEKSTDKDIKQFAQKMIDEHTNAANKLKATVQASGVDTNLVTTDLDSKHQKIMNNLQEAKGDDFDKEYIEAQKDAHKDAVSLFSKYSTSGDDKPLQDFAKQTLPTLEKHQDHVKELKADKS